MAEYTFKIDFTDNGKKFTATSVVEHNKWFGTANVNEMLIEALKDVFVRHPNANDIHWKLI
jgi:hypothetical protein